MKEPEASPNGPDAGDVYQVLEPAVAPAAAAMGVSATLIGRENGSPAVVAARPARPGLLVRLWAAIRPVAPETPAPAADGAALPPGAGRKKTRSIREELPAWAVSAVVHVTVFAALATATLTPGITETLVRTIDSAPFDPRLGREQSEELVHILAEPAALERDQAVGPLSTTMVAGGMPGVGGGLGTGSGPPSATPALAGRGRGTAGGIGEGSLPSVKVGSRLSPVALLPTTPTRDLSGGGGIGGDVTRETGSIGEALDQLAAEILRQLALSKLTVIWLFDESGSMRDDQQAIKEKFDRVASELKLNLDEDRRSSGALNHVILGFGARFDVILGKPTTDIDQIGRAIDRLPIDETGIENTMGAIQRAISEYGRLVSKERRLMIVLVTDESGDDGSLVEEARQMAVSKGVPIYVIGRQSLFGYDRAHLLYVDPVTKDHYWPAIRRGPETAAPECLQWDGLHERWDEQPSGFAPYELARLVRDTGGIYFLLPSEENMRVRQREKAYSMKTLKEYVPDYRSRSDYFKQRSASELRTALAEVIEITKGFGYRRHFPIDLAELEPAMLAEVPVVRQRLEQLVALEARLRSLAKAREREPDRRWQAHYDLILAQIVAYQIKAYEYLACFDEMVARARQGKLVPSKMPVKDQLVVEWVLNHSTETKAPPQETEKKRAEAERLLKEVIARHPNTPWADLAQDELNRGFSVSWGEWHASPQYQERAKLVPKY
jgi:hypothetical protein